ncbi:MAG: hypothetical protein ACI92Z_000331 [Paracoccaceae bacterium]|jgi:hypothetical protein
MAHTNNVLRSINLDGETVSVDIFQRPDGSFGFDEFRRDVEDGRGWFSIGHHGHIFFDSEAKALSAAAETVGWLDP